MNKKIKILVIPSDTSGCGFYRSLRPHKYMTEHYEDEFDIDIIYKIPYSDNLYEFFKQYDIVHIHKMLDKELELIKLIKFVGCKVIVDVDDYWSLGNDHPMSLMSKKENWHIPVIEHLKMADLVTTTTNDYRNEILKYNKNVAVIPNAIEPTDSQFILSNKKSKLIRFGIICGSSHYKDILQMSGMIKQLPKEILDKIQIVLCGFDTNGTTTIYHQDTGKIERRNIYPKESIWYKYEQILTDNYSIISKEHYDFLQMFVPNSEYPNVENEHYRRCWTKSINEYYQHYDSIDVLLVPLKDNMFNRMKSPLKVAEAGFAHKAIIANATPPYVEDLVPLIEKGGKINENGNALLVEQSKNHKQWAKYIIKLVNNPELITKMQNNLYETVKDKYSLENVTKKRVEEYKKLLEE